jgi:hypothetical protein
MRFMMSGRLAVVDWTKVAIGSCQEVVRTLP